METKQHLVLVPGMMCDARLWSAQLEYLEEYCASITVVNTTEHDSIEAIANAALEHLPDSFAVAGLSMGGFVVFEMWKQAAERVNRIALLDTNAHADISERARQRDQLLQRAVEGEFEQVVAEALKPVYLAEVNKDDQVILETVMNMALDLGTEVFERQCVAIKHRKEYESVLSTITVPTLVLCGIEDQLCSVEIHKQMAAAINNSTLELIENCGHLSTMEQPTLVNTAMKDWLFTAES